MDIAERLELDEMLLDLKTACDMAAEIWKDDFPGGADWAKHRAEEVRALRDRLAEMGRE